MMNRHVLSILCLLFLLVACSKYGEIEGRVVNKISQKPINGATVAIKGTTLSAKTEDKGYYSINRIIPGPQKIVASKEGFLSIGEIEITIAKGTIVTASDIYLVPKPPGIGLFDLSTDSFLPIAIVPKHKWFQNPIQRCLVLSEDKIPKLKVVNTSLEMLLYEGDKAEKPSDISLFSMRYVPLEKVWEKKPCWVIEEKGLVEGIEIVSITPELSSISGNINPGRYCLAVEPKSFYLFDVK